MTNSQEILHYICLIASEESSLISYSLVKNAIVERYGSMEGNGKFTDLIFNNPMTHTWPFVSQQGEYGVIKSIGKKYKIQTESLKNAEFKVIQAAQTKDEKLIEATKSELRINMFEERIVTNPNFDSPNIKTLIKLLIRQQPLVFKIQKTENSVRIIDEMGEIIYQPEDSTTHLQELLIEMSKGIRTFTLPVKLEKMETRANEYARKLNEKIKLHLEKKFGKIIHSIPDKFLSHYKIIFSKGTCSIAEGLCFRPDQLLKN